MFPAPWPTRPIRASVRRCIPGQLKPGHKLRFSELQELTDTSVTPVREALARLTAEGFTELEGHRGYRVAPVSSTDLWDIVRNRQRLESEALSLSIKHGDDHWEAQLVTAHHLLGLMDRERADLPTAVDEQWEPRHQAFHEALIAACSQRCCSDSAASSMPAPTGIAASRLPSRTFRATSGPNTG